MSSKTYKGKDLPEVTVTRTKQYQPVSFGQALSNAFSPLFGKQRVETAKRGWTKYPETMQAFVDGQNTAANALMSTYLLGAGVVPTVETVAEMTVPQAIATVGGGVAGGAAGAEVLNTALKANTGMTWEEAAVRNGVWPVNAIGTNPGGAVGSAVGSYITSSIANNFVPILANNNPRIAMTPNGPVMVKPGDLLRVPAEPISYQNAPQGQTRYQARYTGKPSGAKGSSAGQGGHSVKTNGTKTTSRGVSNRVMSDIQSGQGQGPVITTPFTPYNPMGQALWTPFGYMPDTPLPVAPPVVEPEPEYRYVEEKPYIDPFITWYGKQKEGTTQYYSGSEGHPAGQYVIHRTKADPKATERNVYDQNGYLVKDSTTITPNVAVPYHLDKVLGGVPAEAERVSTINILGNPVTLQGFK